MTREGMTVSQLGDAVGMTPRNIRAYQSRGLLEPPVIVGRVAMYSGVHAARLRLIGSLQREGFTLAAIKRLLENPGSYSAIVADRRRRFRDGDADMPATVPVSEERIRAQFPEAPDDLTETGLVWADTDGQLVSPATVVGVARTLLGLGLPSDVVAMLQLEAVRSGRELGRRLRVALDAVQSGSSPADLGKVAVQLSGAAFEIAFLAAATDARLDDTAGAVDGGSSRAR